MNPKSLQSLTYTEAIFASHAIFDSLRYELLCRRAQVLIQAKRYESALITLNRAILLRIDRPDAWLLRATTLLFLQRYREALICCDRAATLSVDLAFTWALRGVILQRLGQYKDCYDSYAQALGKTDKPWWQKLHQTIVHQWQRLWGKPPTWETPLPIAPPTRHTVT
jgi:tetratricopeptide (TPR) repeat protein